MTDYPFIGMLAKGGDVEQLLEYDKQGLYAEPKLDGIRFILYINKDGEAHLVSRGDNDNVEKYPFLDKPNIPREFYDSIFDGEMVVQNDSEYVHSLADMQSVNGASTEKARGRCEQLNVQFVLFDVLRFQGEDVTVHVYLSRRRILLAIRDAMFRRQIKNDSFKVITAVKGAVADLYARIVGEGGEGIMVKHPYSPYVSKRAKGWIKVKHTEISEGVIVASTPGKGRNEGLVGSVLISIDESGKKTRGCFGAMSDAFRREITSPDIAGKLAPKWYGKRVRVKYYPGGVHALRHCQLIKVLDEEE